MASEHDYADITPGRATPAPADVTHMSGPTNIIGRYIVHAPIARGGMATIHLAHLLGAQGFNRLVTAKRLHPEFAEDPEFVSMFHDEARIASRIHHANVVSVLDVVVSGTDVALVQEYVHGVPLSHLCSRSFREGNGNKVAIPVNITVAVVVGILAGLHAAHETRDEVGEPLCIVHRDVSPQNVIVSADGVPRLLDFGIAKARSSSHITRAGVFKGKVAYMAPEQLRLEATTRKVDIYSAGIILWEMLAHRRMREAQDQVGLFANVLSGEIPSLAVAIARSPVAWTPEQRDQALALEGVLRRALSRHAADRFETAAEMGKALLEVCPVATSFEIAEWVRNVAFEYLAKRQQLLLSVESSVRARSGAYELPPASDTRPVVSGVASNHIVVRPLLELRRDRRLPTWAIALLTCALLIAGAAFFSFRNDAARTSQGPASSPMVSLTHPSAAPPTPVAPTVSAPARVAPVASVAALPSLAPIPESLASEAPAAAIPDAPAAVVPTTHPPARRTGSGSKARSGTSSAPPASATTATAAPAPSSACDPPFYFEGTHKVFKPNCI